MSQTFATGSSELDYAIRDQWGAGFVTDWALTVDDAVYGWEITFELDADITNIWNAEIVSKVGNVYTIRGLSYNANLGDGGTATFGFVANGTSTDIDAGSVEINGEAVSDSDDPPPPDLPELTIDAPTVTEGVDQQAVYRLQLDEPADHDVVVIYSTFDVSAVASEDYQAQSGQIVIPAGSTFIDIPVDLIDSPDVESTETFGLRIDSVDGATAPTIEAVATILDIDVAPPAEPIVTFADITVTEGEAVSSPPADPDSDAPVGSILGALSTDGNQIVDADGDPIQIKAVNWFGLETEVFAPHGLWARNWKDMMDQMVELGFNAIRLPFSSELVLEQTVPSGINYALNPDLAGLSGMEIMDKIVAYAEALGMGVILDHHRSEAGSGANGGGLWHEGAYSEADWIAAWENLAIRYGDNTAIIGADLHNEPHGPATWGDGGANDWHRAAELAGDAILQEAPDWLIIVEGIGSYQGDNYWWGGNLMGVATDPVELSIANKVVYSPHDYPASVYNQPWFSDGSDLYEVFHDHWGYIFEDEIAPILIGEFGSRLETSVDQAWADAITTYISGDFDGDAVNDLEAGDLGVSFAWWSWNPNSGDTGGILLDDWTTPRDNAVTLLEPLLEGGAPATGGTGTPVFAYLTVALDAPAAEAFNITYTTEDGTALAGLDYVAESGSLNFAAGEQEKTIAIEILGDDIEEGAESFSVHLTGAIDGDLTAVVTIDDDDGTTTPPDDPGDGGSSDEALTALFTIRNDWGSGATIDLAITNNGDTAITDWDIAFNLDSGIGNIWNGVIIDSDGGRYTVADAGYNATIGAGQTVVLGFNTTSGGFDAAQLNEDADFII